MDSSTNPLFKRLTRGANWPSRRYWLAFTETVLAAALVAVVSAFLSGGAPYLFRGPFFSRGPYDPIMFTLRNLGPYAVAILMPIPAALIAARDITSEDFQMMRITLLTSHKIVTAYFWATLYRMRWLLLVCLGFVVPYFVFSSFIFFAYSLGTSQTSFYYDPLTLRLFTVVSNGIVVAALTVLAAVLGVGLGLVIRHGPLAASLGMGVVAAIYEFDQLLNRGVRRVYYFNLYQANSAASSISSLVTFRLLLPVLLLAVMALATWQILRLAERRVSLG